MKERGLAFLPTVLEAPPQAMPARPLPCSCSGSMALLLAIPLVAALAVDEAQLTQHWHDAAAHGLVEGFCALMALVLFYVLRSEAIVWRNRRLSLMAHGFLALGVLTGLHALARPGSNAFVFLHCLSGVAAAALFVLSLRRRRSRAGERRAGWASSAGVALSSLLGGLVVVAADEYLPIVEGDGSFAPAAILLNVLSSMLYLGVGLSFVRAFRRQREPILFVVAGAMLLFAEMHGMFVLSQLWNVHWWAWHFVKAGVFVALLAALAYEFGEVLREVIAQKAEIAVAYDRMVVLQTSLVEAEKQAALGQVGAVVAHEIRNPLGTITTCLGVLRRAPCNAEERTELVALMEREAERLEGIVAETLALARGRPARHEPVRLAELAAEVLDGLAASLGPGMALERRLAPVPVIHGNPQQLRQLVWNLVTNAVEALPGAGRIELGLAVAAGAVELWVRDDGPGIPEQVRARLFEPFVSTKASGTGLGLAIVRRIVDDHRGGIGVDSPPGRGTTIKVRLPLPAAALMEGGMPGILIVDDQEGMRRSLEIVLRKEGYAVATASGMAEAEARVEAAPPDLVLVDLRLEPGSGIELLQRVKRRAPATEVIVMTAFATVDTAVSAMKLGAFDYLVKPFRNEELVLKVQRALEKRPVAPGAALPASAAGATGLVAESPAMRLVVRHMAQLAPTELTILLTGETGTGKTAAAQAIHAMSPRAGQPFVHVNCAALPDTLLEAELFGHERGAFTGATASRRGLFEEAHRGTLFLDEIALLPLGLQSKLLTVLEDRQVRRIGANRATAVDVRVIAATNADLKHLLANGQFRQDLYFRVNVAPIILPPLRERRDDIPALVQAFCSRLDSGSGRRLGVAEAALAALSAYSYPGNVRELANILAWAHAVAKPPAIGLDDLPEHLLRPPPPAAAALPSLAALEWQAIERTIAQHEGNLTRAARALGIGRTTLWRRLRSRGGS